MASHFEMEFVAESKEPVLGGKIEEERKTYNLRFNSGANRVFEMSENPKTLNSRESNQQAATSKLNPT